MSDLLSTDSKEKEDNQKKQSEVERIKELNDLRKVLSLAEGRRVWWRLMARAGAWRTPYTGETNSTNYQCGSQAIGFFMLDELLEASPTTFLQMQREAKSEAKNKSKENKET